MLTHLDLFSGIGGFALAADWAGFETIGFVEIDPCCQKVLNKHWPDVPVVEDIRDVETIKTVAEVYSGNRPITLITGGFPCQPFSVAGKRRGKGDNRYLWPEMLRVISEVRPRWVLGENVAGIVRMELDNVLSDLEREGYTCQAFVIPACAVNAWHRRDRVWIVAYTQCCRCDTGGYRLSREPNTTSGENTEASKQDGSRQRIGISEASQADVALASTNRLEGTIQTGDSISPTGTIVKGCAIARGNSEGATQWAVEPELGRVAHGIPNRVDRLKCLGNAIVPQVTYQIIKLIAQIETGECCP